MAKTKILFVTEASFLNSGYATYAHYILRELSKNPNYEVAEFATFVHPNDTRINSITGWKVYPNIPPIPVEEYGEWAKNVQNQFGAALFNNVILDFEPDVVCTHSDWWMQKFINDSPYRSHFKYIWMAPCDAVPQNIEWLEDMIRCDGVLTYTDWAKAEIEKSSPNVKVYASAAPSAQDFFQPLNKEALKQHLGIDPNSKFIGTVMRNQVRKLFPDLFYSFRKFLDETKSKDIYLYCHTSYPDGSWRIPELIQEYGIADKTLFTYICQNCKYVFPAFYSDITTCKQCGQISACMPATSFGVPSQTLAHIYNLFDLYVQYASNEGFGISQVEAAACGVPIMSVDYSAMSDVVRKLGGEPIKVKALYKEIATGCMRAVPDNEHFISLLKTFFNKPATLRRLLGVKTRNLFEKYYKWEESGKRWSELIDSIKGEYTWNISTEIPPMPNENMHPEMSNNEYAKWLIKDVANWPEKEGSFMEMQLVRDLNYARHTGAVIELQLDDSSLFNQNKTLPFNRDIAYKTFRHIGHGRRMAELERCNKYAK